MLDEPSLGLAPVMVDQLADAIVRLHGGGLTILLVEHDMDAVFALADHLTVMVNGQVIASDTPVAVRADAGVQAAYLGEESEDTLGEAHGDE
jgi:branched-chain amino acid transport system ATP-binding protein